jgi:hypothetical protein
MVLEPDPDWEENGFVFAALALGWAAKAKPVGQMPVG